MFKPMQPGTSPEQRRSLFGFHWLGAGRYYLRGVQRRVAFLLLFVGAGLVLAQPCAGGSGVFENTGSLATTRTSHTAALLPNGNVLVTGGGLNEAPIPSEMYDPASRNWTSAGSFADEARAAHTATLLPNGKMLIAGGVTHDPRHIIPLQSTRLYDPSNGSWAASGNLGTARWAHTATLLRNGKVLITGGISALFDNTYPLASAELYDPALGTWAATGSLTTTRAYHTATLLPNGKVLVAGGYLNGTYGHLESAELYDPASGTWAATGSLVTARAVQSATLLRDGKVLVLGGWGTANGTVSVLASAELYDPSSGNWAATGSLATGRYLNTATLLSDGKVLVAGGYVGGTTDDSWLKSAELYDPASGTWAATGDLLTRRAAHTATLLPNGDVLVAGGYGPSGNYLVAELYVGPATPPTLLNVATRMRVLTGDQVLIGGFIITGTELKRVLIRGIGPSLNDVGITLSDPTLELHQGSTTVATNDNWKMRPDTTSQQADIEATTIAPANDLEPAILVSLSPGAYTAILSGKNGGTGVGLVEVYDLGQGANSRLANISTRGFVETGDNVMIGGLIVGGGGGGTARVLVRALGPSVPVAGALPDPNLELHDGSGALVASNDNWKTRPDGSSQQGEIEATALQPVNDLDSALVRTLSPGNYTAIVRGTNNNTGVGLVEAYNLP